MRFLPAVSLGFLLAGCHDGTISCPFPVWEPHQIRIEKPDWTGPGFPTGTHVPAWFDKADLEGDKTRWEGCLTVAFDARILQWGSVEEMDDCLRRFRLGDVGDRGFAPLPVRKARGLISGDTGADVLTAPSIHQCVGQSGWVATTCAGSAGGGRASDGSIVTGVVLFSKPESTIHDGVIAMISCQGTCRFDGCCSPGHRPPCWSAESTDFMESGRWYIRLVGSEVPELSPFAVMIRATCGTTADRGRS